MIIFFFILAFTLGNLYKIPVFSPEIKISLLDLTLFIFILKSLIFNFSEIKIKISVFKPLVLFVIWSLFTLLLSWHIYGTSAFIVGFLYLFRFAMYSSAFIFIPTKINKSHTIKLLLGLSLALIVACITQYLVFPDIRLLAISEWDPHYFRVVGTFLDPGFVGLLLLFSLIYLYFHPLKNLLRHRLVYGLNYLAFALTYSRSSFLAAIAAVSYISYLRKSWKLFILGNLLILATLFLLPRAPGGEGVKLERTSSIQARIINWTHSLSIIRDHSIFGVGFNVYRYAQKNYGFLDNSIWLKSHAGAGADSSLLFTAATTGLVGLGLYIYYLRSMWYISSNSTTLHASLVALFVHSLFLNSLFYPFVLFWLSLLIVCDS